MTDRDYKTAHEFLVRRVTAIVEAMRNPRLADLPFDDLLELALLNAAKQGAINATLHR